MKEENLKDVFNLINKRYEEQDMPEDVLEARVVLILKKGDTADLANYRPISLLNVFYKLLAAMMQVRLAENGQIDTTSTIWF